MTTTTRFISMAAAVLAAAVMTACAGGDELADTPQQPENQNRVITLTTTVGLGGGAADAGDEASGASAGTRGDASGAQSGDSESVMRGGGTTRALTSDGVKTFAVGETMALVYRSVSKRTVVVPSEALTDVNIASDGKSATFTFNLTEEPDKKKDVTYIYPAAMADADGNENYDALFTEQDGTLAKLASNFDFATTHNNLDWDGDNLPGATLENQLAILAITLKDYVTGADITGSITGLTLTTRNNSHTESMTYNITRSAAPGPIYVAIHPTMLATINVTATFGAYTYTKTLEGKVYQASNGYNVSWRMTDVTPTKTVPLTMEALTAGTIVVKDPQEGMKYSVNGGDKTTMSGNTTISVSAGDKVQFYGDGTSITSYEGTTIAGIGYGFKCKVYGNIMSLVNETGFATATTLPEEYTFSYLFSCNDNLTDASGLLLPATTLADYCYSGMFYGCTSLTTAPALPATTLDDNCYQSMFERCTSLETAPALPATKLAEGCYTGMFNGCTSLTTAPALPATTLDYYGCYEGMFEGCSSLTAAPALPATKLASGCYNGMFRGCTSLTAAPALPAETLVAGCYLDMFDGCTSLTAAPALPATTLKLFCYQSMFEGCTSLTTAPALPAEKLQPYCYKEMFYGCTKLSAVTCLATDISAPGCTEDWLSGAGTQAEGTKTFTKAASTNWSTGPSGIPDGWTVQDAQ